MCKANIQNEIDTESLQTEQMKTVLRNLSYVQLLGVRIHTLQLEQLLDLLTQAVTNQEKILLSYVNAHALNMAYDCPRFRYCLNRADLVFCDGFGVKWGARLLGLNINQRYTPPDWILNLSTICSQRGFSIFLLGARPGVAEQAALVLQTTVNQLKIVGVYHGYFDKTLDSENNELVIKRINAVQPDILIVGFGMPLQEYWLEENWPRIDAKIALPVGAALDFIAGTTYRGPSWLTDYGFEWLTRLIVEPQRLWRRYLFGNPLFVWRILKQRFSLLTL